MDETWARSYKPNLKRQSNEWQYSSSPRPKKVRLTQCTVKVMFIVAYDIDGVILHHAVPPRQSTTAPPSSRAQEKATMLGGTEPHLSSWQHKEAHRCCCPGPLVPLAKGDSGTSTILTRYESTWFLSLCQSERTTARDPVQHMRWTYPCYKVVNIRIRISLCMSLQGKGLLNEGFAPVKSNAVSYSNLVYLDGFYTVLFSIFPYLTTVCLSLRSTAVEQVVACALVMQRAWVRSPFGTSFLGEVFLGFFHTCKMNVRKL